MKKDYYLSFVVLLQLIITTFQLLLPLYGLVSIERAATLRIVVTLATFLPGIIIVFQRKPKLLFLFFIGYAFFLLFNYIFYPASHEFIESSRAYTLTPISILTVLFVVSIRDFDNFLRVLLYISRLCPLVGALYVFGMKVMPFVDEESTYSMSFGYSFLLPTLFLFHQDKLVDKVLSLLLLMMILADGSRGPVIVCALFYMYELLFATKAKNKVKVLALFVVLVATSVWILTKSDYMESSRTLILAMNGELVSHDSGRTDMLYVPAIKKIEESPVLGWGIGSDRDLLGFYTHNVFLEVFMHYGYFGGGILFLFYFINCVRAFNKKNKLALQGGRSLYIMLFLFGFVPLLVSGSYLISFHFAVLIGYMIRLFKIRLPRKNSEYDSSIVLDSNILTQAPVITANSKAFV